MISTLARLIFHAIGWRLEGRYPSELKKKILIVAPHTSAIDFPIGFLVKVWLRIKVTFYAKEELFKGLIGWFLRKVGGRPVDRSTNNNLVSQAVADFGQLEEHTILITPEGTRRKVKKFKTGFYYIALQAGVPIVPVAFDYGLKAVRIFPTYFVKGNGESEIEKIRSMFKGIKGKKPDQGII